MSPRTKAAIRPLLLPRLLALARRKPACPEHVDWIENSLNQRPRKKCWEGQVQINVLSPSFGNGITALFGCVWVAASALFAGFCRGKLLIFFVVNVANGTHNLLVPGSNPGGPTVRINHFRWKSRRESRLHLARFASVVHRGDSRILHSCAASGCKSVP